MFYKIVGVLKGVLKKFANFTGKYLCWVWCERFTFSFNLYYKRDSCIQLFAREFRRIFKKTFLSEHSKVSASDFTFGMFKSNQTNTWKWVFYLSFFKTKQESWVALKLENSRFALQWSSSFVELRVSSY